MMGGGERRQYAVKDTIERALADAREKGLWFYDKSYKKWFTPDEFEIVAEQLALTRLTPDQVLSSFLLRDPRDGMMERVRYMEKVITEFKVFAEKVRAYQSPPANSGAVKRQ